MEVVCYKAPLGFVIHPTLGRMEAEANDAGQMEANDAGQMEANAQTFDSAFFKGGDVLSSIRRHCSCFQNVLT